LIVHHGLFLERRAEGKAARNYRKMRLLMDADMAIYSAHLPLDIHPRSETTPCLQPLWDSTMENHFSRPQVNLWD
jgi:putative NIF3 family GTP cyclohydrolase 1 type 2